jgi:predicted deacylase
MTIYRSYQKLVNEILNLRIPFRVEIIGYVSYGKQIYPLIAIRHITKNAKKNIVIYAGQHGDEFFSVHILIKWIQQFDTKLFQNYNIFIYPIINPWGYEYNKRMNGLNQDTNDEKNFVKNSKVQELAVLFEDTPTTVDLLLDIHGDADKEKCYSYERKLDNLPSLAEIALQEIYLILPYIKSKTIYKMLLEKGVIKTPWIDEGIEVSAEKTGAEYTITLELPGKANSQKRTEGGIAFINSVLHHYAEIK